MFTASSQNVVVQGGLRLGLFCLYNSNVHRTFKSTIHPNTSTSQMRITHRAIHSLVFFAPSCVLGFPLRIIGTWITISRWVYCFPWTLSAAFLTYSLR